MGNLGDLTMAKTLKQVEVLQQAELKIVNVYNFNHYRKVKTDFLSLIIDEEINRTLPKIEISLLPEINNNLPKISI